jgi:restriction system protein
LESVPIPSYVDLMLPTLRALEALGGSGTSSEIDDTVISQEGLTDEQLAVEFPPEARQTGSKVVHRLAWARTYLKKFGAVNNSQRGVWTLEAGAEPYLAMPTETAADALRKADADVRREYRRTREDLPRPSSAESDQGESSEDEPLLMEEESWKRLLLKQVMQLTPQAFERLSGRLLREVGFTKVEVLGRSDDKGIDGRGLLQMTPLTSLQVFFQCKRYETAVAPHHVRDFRGAMTGRGIQGLIITTSTFTRGAKEEASRDGAPLIDLIDGEELCELMKGQSLGVTVELVESVTVQPEFFTEL